MLQNINTKQRGVGFAAQSRKGHRQPKHRSVLCRIGERNYQGGIITTPVIFHIFRNYIELDDIQFVQCEIWIKAILENIKQEYIGREREITASDSDFYSRRAKLYILDLEYMDRTERSLRDLQNVEQELRNLRDS